ncbi:MAG: type II toxin-antitoxin system prevent-host-death family antitoxin [Terracidiphilus sp.]|jgi:prevent-host-death family protein
MRTINIHKAKTHLSRLVDEAEQGESFIIAKAGKPKVQVTAIPESHSQRKSLIGAMKGMFTLPENFEQIDRELDKEIERLFLGEDAQ